MIKKKKEKITSKKKRKEKVKNRRKDKHKRRKKKAKISTKDKKDQRKDQATTHEEINRMTKETEKKRTERLKSFERWPGQFCPKYCQIFSPIFSLQIGVIHF